MKRPFLSGVVAAVALVGALAATAEAVSVNGYVYCDTNGNGVVDQDDTPIANVTVNVNLVATGTLFASAVTDASGFYQVSLIPVVQQYGYDAQVSVSLDLQTLPPGSTVLGPTPFLITVGSWYAPGQHDWLTTNPSCGVKGCWLTGGGGKFSPITGTSLAETGKGPGHSFGGNVNPGCSPEAGEGGQWNDVAHTLKLHFQARAIEVVRCGNVPGIPDGSESPQTPYNFIEFRGTGTLKGIHGNKVDYGNVQFAAYVEDRNEPGSSGAKDGALVDRYFLRVFDLGGTTLMLVDVDGDPMTVDPVAITDGNLQLHISSCSTPPQ